MDKEPCTKYERTKHLTPGFASFLHKIPPMFSSIFHELLEMQSFEWLLTSIPSEIIRKP